MLSKTNVEVAEAVHPLTAFVAITEYVPAVVPVNTLPVNVGELGCQE